MKNAMTAVGLALALSLGFGATDASAQRAKEAQQRAKQKQAGGTITIGDRTLKISADAATAVVELQTAVNANDVANIPSKLAAAKAVAKTPDEKYIVAKLQLQAAGASKDDAAIVAAINEVLASGIAPQAETITLYKVLARNHLAAKRNEQAQAALERLKQLSPNDPEVQSLLTASYSSQGRTGDVLEVVQQQIASAKAAGQVPAEDLYKRAVALAYQAKMPSALGLSQSWVEAYPKPSNWRDALQIYINSGIDDPTTLDVLRLARAVGALTHEVDFEQYGYLSTKSPAPAEAKAVVEEGIAAGKVNANKQNFKEILREATRNSQGQKGRLPALAADARTSSTAKLAQNAGDIYYSYDEFAKAADMYRTALTKSGADKDLLNLRLGAALARAGDAAGATAALNAVGGKRAELAKFWLVYLKTRA